MPPSLPPTRRAASARAHGQNRGLAARSVAVAALCLATLAGAGCLGPAEGHATPSPVPAATLAQTPWPAATAARQTTAPPATAGVTIRPTTVVPTPATPSGDTQRAEVVAVVDGDSIKVSLDGHIYSVRYIGIDAPEMGQPGRPAEWMGPEATAMNAELVAGRTVTLEKDMSETDAYGRLLRYVYVGDRMVNAELVRLGYARAPSYPPDLRHQDYFSRLEAEARDAGRGLWGPAPTPATPITETPTSREGCDPAYPDVCIPPPPPDLDCVDIPYRRFRVLPPDPHHFDGGHDGIGCEGE